MRMIAVSMGKEKKDMDKDCVTRRGVQLTRQTPVKSLRPCAHYMSAVRVSSKETSGETPLESVYAKPLCRYWGKNSSHASA